MSKSKECPICIDKFNETTRKCITCLTCETSVCKSCTETYILSTFNEPDCMNCHKTWNTDFIRDNMTKTFCESKLKKHRENMLYDREKSLLPATQGFIVQIKQKQAISEKISKLLTAKYNLDKQIEIHKKEYRAVDEVNPETEASKQKFIKNCPMKDCRGFLSSSYKCGTCSVWVCPDCKEIKGFNKDVDHTCDPDTLATIKAIEADTKPCPNCTASIYKIEGCFAKDTPMRLYNGSIRPVQDIEIGDTLIGDDGTKRTVLMTCIGDDNMYSVNQSTGVSYIVNSAHTLVLVDNITNQEIEIMVKDYLKLSNTRQRSLKGIKAISGELMDIYLTKEPFQTYYGFMVDKNSHFILPDMTIVSNCSQMFCTACNTVFDWKTNKITAGGAVHNPHYFEWVKKNGGAVRQLGDVPCGGLPYLYRFEKNIIGLKDYDLILRIYRIVAEVSDYWRRKYNTTSSLHGNRDLRIKFLMKYISEEEFKKQLQVREKKQTKHTAIRQILDTFMTVGTENMLGINDAKYNTSEKNSLETIRQCVEQMQEIRKYTNECLSDLSKKFSCKVPIVELDWSKVITNKF